MLCPTCLPHAVLTVMPLPRYPLWRVHHQVSVPLAGKVAFEPGVHLQCPSGFQFLDLFSGMYGPSGSYTMSSQWCTISAGRVKRSTLQFGCSPCPNAQYSLSGGFSNGTADMAANPPCLACPVGATCSGNLLRPQANYWGDSDTEGVVHMALCPAGYCCTLGFCNVSSCAPHRTGPLCGDCEHGFVQAVGSSACVPATVCDTDIPTAWPVVVIIVFALGLLQLRVVSGVWSTDQRRPSNKTKPLIYFAQVNGPG